MFTYRADLAKNAILESSYKGNRILDGQRIPKGVTIDLVIGSTAATPFPLPDFSGMKDDEVELYLLGVNLRIGEINSVANNCADSTVQKQNPVAGTLVKHFDVVDLWVFNFKK